MEKLRQKILVEIDLKIMYVAQDEQEKQFCIINFLHRRKYKLNLIYVSNVNKTLQRFLQSNYFFSRQLVNVTGGELRMVGGHPVDMYYVGKEYLHDYVEILEVFFKHSVFVEVAVTTVLVCIEDSRKTQVFYRIFHLLRCC